MPQKILLYRFPTEKMAGIHPHALEKNPNKVTFLTFSLRVIMLAPDRSCIGRIPTSIMASH